MSEVCHNVVFQNNGALLTALTLIDFLELRLNLHRISLESLTQSLCLELHRRIVQSHSFSKPNDSAGALEEGVGMPGHGRGRGEALRFWNMKGCSVCIRILQGIRRRI